MHGSTLDAMLNRLRTLLVAARNDLRSRSERGALVRSALGTALLKAIATLLAFLASLLYARVLGPSGFGAYSYVLAWATIWTIPAGLGVPQFLIREGARFPDLLRPLRRWADRWVTIGGIMAALAIFAISLLPAEAGRNRLLLLVAPIPLITNLSSVRMSLLQAQGHVAKSQWPQLVLAPALTLSALIVVWIFSGSLSTAQLVAATSVSSFVPLLINSRQLRLDGGHGNFAGWKKLRLAVPFMFLSALYLINNRVDLVMLGMMKASSDAGTYAVASRIAELILFANIAINTAIAPKISKIYHSGNMEKLEKLMQAASQRCLLITLPLALLFIAAAGTALPLIYGNAYADSAIILRILTVAQFGVISLGSVGTLLTMTGHQTQCALGVLAAAVVNVVLNTLLIPRLGAVGAALSTGLSLVMAQIILWIWVRRNLSIRPSGWGI